MRRSPRVSGRVPAACCLWLSGWICALGALGGVCGHPGFAALALALAAVAVALAAVGWRAFRE